MNRLWVKLAVAFGLVALVAVGSVALVVNRTTASSFRGYIGQQNLANSGELIRALQDHYATQGRWDGAQQLLPGQHGRGAGPGQGAGQGGEGPNFLVADAGHIVVAANESAQIGRKLTREERQLAVALEVEGETVGYLLRVTPGGQALDRAQQQFLSDVSRALAVTAIAATVLAVALGLALAWTLIHPLRRLQQSAVALADGHLGVQVPLGGAQELREVGAAFNRMSAALREGEVLRQRMTSDIAHELRSPVSVMRGQLEAMMDGVFPTTTEQLAVVYDQTLHLSRLIEDLRTLTRAEAGSLPLEPARVEPGALVQRVVGDFAALAQDQAISLTAQVAPDLPTVQADAGRLRQVLANLLANALKHTPSGGQIRVSAAREGPHVRFTVSDTGPGLTREQAAHIFERFYRTDEARQRDQSGSGLGLAIAQELVRLHGGRMWVESTVGQGSRFIFEIPAE